MKRAVFLYNAQSGKGRIKRNVERICDIFREAEYDLEPVPIDFDANPFDGREEIGLMVVAGGDGTVNFAVNAMKQKGLDIPIGIIPAGTANDFARALGMSDKPLEAARQIAFGSIDRVDCGRVNGQYFVNEQAPHRQAGLSDRGRQGVPLAACRAARSGGRQPGVRPRFADGAGLQR